MSRPYKKGKSKRDTDTGKEFKKGYKSNSKRTQAMEEREYDYNAQKSGPNDWRYYAQNEQLLKDTASLPYSWPLGNKLDLGPYATYLNKGSIPGLFAIHTAPTFGYSEEPNSPINVAVRNIYTFVRHNNSGHTNYDPVDLGVYLMAMDSCYSFLSFVRRIYGVVATYSFTNRYFPTAAVRAMGVDFTDIQTHLADFRAWINSIAVKFGSMVVPASMSYMAKHMWLYQGLYYDSTQDKPQTYLFVPDGFYRFELDEDLAGSLVYHRLMKIDTSFAASPVEDSGDESLLTFDELVAYGNSLIDPILRSEDMNIMSGDILKAFGADNVYKMESISDTYTVLPSYDETVLDQIQNMTIVGRFSNDTAVLKQSPSKGWLMYTPKFHFPYQFTSVEAQSAGENFLFSSKFVNFDHGNIEPKDTMEATRMTQVCHEQDEVNKEWTYKTLASEVAMYAYIYFFAEDSNGKWKLHRSRTIHSANTVIVDPAASGSSYTIQVTVDDSVGYSEPATLSIRVPDINPQTILNAYNPVILLTEQVSMFNRHPAMAITMGITTGGAAMTTAVTCNIVPDTAGGTGIGWADQPFTTQETPAGTPSPLWSKWESILEDINYYTIVDEKNLVNLANTALLSMFNVTQYGRVAE